MAVRYLPKRNLKLESVVFVDGVRCADHHGDGGCNDDGDGVRHPVQTNAQSGNQCIAYAAPMEQ